MNQVVNPMHANQLNHQEDENRASVIGPEPDQLDEGASEAQKFQAICRYIQAWGETSDSEFPSLEVLSRMAGLSVGHFQRRFKAMLGVSPKQYAKTCQFQQFKQQLIQGKPVTTALYEAGFGSSSRVYENLDTQLGMTPAQYRRGGKGLIISYGSAPSPLGLMMLGATDRGLCFLQWGVNEMELLASLRQEFPQAELLAMAETARPLFEQWMALLRRHLEGRQPNLDLPLDIQGTVFQTRVWRYLQQIPYGTVQSYSQVAQGMGQPKAVRAVASACAANRLAILIPCHRVIRSDGGLGGYRWGLATKAALLKGEQTPFTPE